MLRHRKTLSRLLFHFLFWMGLYLVIFLSFLRYDELAFSFQLSTFQVGSLILPIYFHAYIFEKFFQEEKYYIYGFVTILIILSFGSLNSWLLSIIFEDVKSESYLTLTIFMFMYTGFRYLKIGTKLQFKLELEEKKRIKAENELLKSQVNPHFMFNALNSIYSLIMSKDERSAEAVLLLSGLMRYLLESSKRKAVSLVQECDFLKNYINLERIRLGNRCNINFEISGDLENKRIAPMLLIPFVENAFKHGISASSDKNFINIDLKVNKKEICLRVENRIAPKNEVLPLKQNKIGINNVSQRLDLMYAERYELSTSTINDLYTIDLRIEL